MTDLEDFESFIYNKHICISIRRESLFGICIACEIEERINQFKDHKKEENK